MQRLGHVGQILCPARDDLAQHAVAHGLRDVTLRDFPQRSDFGQGRIGGLQLRVVVQPRRVGGPDDPRRVRHGLLRGLAAGFGGLPLLAVLLLGFGLLVDGAGLGAHLRARRAVIHAARLMRATIVTFYAAFCTVAALPTIARQIVPEKLVLMSACPAVGAPEVRHEVAVLGGLQPLAHGADGVSRGRFLGADPLDPLLHVLGQTSQRVGGVLRQVAGVPQGLIAGSQMGFDLLDPPQLGPLDVAGLRHMVDHAAGELIALLLQLVEYLLQPRGLFANLRVGQHAGVGVGEDQLHLVDQGVPTRLPDARHLPEPLLALVHQQLQRRLAPVAGDQHHMAVLSGPHQQRLLQAHRLDVAGQIGDVPQLVEIAGVAVDQADVDVLDLIAALRSRIGNMARQRPGQLAQVKLFRGFTGHPDHLRPSSRQHFPQSCRPWSRKRCTAVFPRRTMT